MKRFRFFLLALLPWIGASIAGAQTLDFETEIAPLLIRRCIECHQGVDPSGGLSMVSQQSLRAGGDSGAVIETSEPESSPLLTRVVDGEMPPLRQGHSQRLSDVEIDTLTRWVRSGVPWPVDRQLDYFERTNDLRAGRDWWSLQAISSPDVPSLESSSQPVSPIDAFIRADLAAAGMVPAPPADPATRLRRLYFDMIGLQPTAVEIDAFVADPSASAWEQAVDRVLASNQYGVRWASYWLDLVRYADTSGYERDQEKPYAWKYRDWVVDAFNNDMPFDQFAMQQLAGDEMESRDKSTRIATGFLRLGTWNDEPNDPMDYQYDRLEDLVHTTSSVFLGMTVKCARCHAHKFDPITQEDYYRMASVFWVGPIDRGGGTLGGPTAEEQGYDDVLAWTDTRQDPPPLHLLKNGERDQPMHEVLPATLSMLPHLERMFDPSPADHSTTTRRLQLARWITDSNNPLTARVLANRLWQHHFGNAIVRSPNNFGFLADPPTHPELLDWLAGELIRGRWQLKRIHKLILMSETWQQSSLHPDQDVYNQQDAGNRFWWRAERRRLDAEALRDQMLDCAGDLDLRLEGVGFRPTIADEALEGLSQKGTAWQPSPESEQNRRSLYMYAKRGLLPPMMTVFDRCDTTQSCGKRDVTIVPTQALAMMNNPFVYHCSVQLANVVIEQHPETVDQISAVWSRVLRRKPQPNEIELALNHLQKQTHHAAESESADIVHEPSVTSLASLVQVLFNSNEFFYVD